MSIDENGDRNADYSLLDLNPDTGLFEVSLQLYKSLRTTTRPCTLRLGLLVIFQVNLST